MVFYDSLAAMEGQCFEQVFDLVRKQREIAMISCVAFNGFLLGKSRESHAKSVLPKYSFFTLNTVDLGHFRFFVYYKYHESKMKWMCVYLTSATSNAFLTNRAWHRAVLSGEDVVLRHTSALEYLELFFGYMHEKTIDVYAKRQGRYENINYHIVDTFNDIDIVHFDTILYTSASQTFSDMLADFDNIDEQALVEGLAGYYYSHAESFDGLSIKLENIKRFSSIKDWAVEFYTGG